jgi:hypothetical protein
VELYLHSLHTRNYIAEERGGLEGRALNLTQKHAADSQGCQPNITLPRAHYDYTVAHETSFFYAMHMFIAVLIKARHWTLYYCS